jgi:hypothetical protein
VAPRSEVGEAVLGGNVAGTKTWRRLAAEFVVIVVGVLVALAFDQWRETLSEQRQGDFYLEALEGDLRADSVALEVAVLRARNVQANLVRFEEILGMDHVVVDPDSVARFVTSSTIANIDPSFATGTMRGLTASGDSRLLQDLGLRSQVLDYLSYTESASGWLAERRETAGRASIPPSLMSSPLFPPLAEALAEDRAPGPPAYQQANAAQELVALRGDFQEIRVWLRRRQLLMAGAQNLLGRLLIERTLPLLESVRAARD